MSEVFLVFGCMSLFVLLFYLMVVLPDDIAYKRFQKRRFKLYAKSLQQHGYWHKGKPIEEIEEELRERIRQTGRFD